MRVASCHARTRRALCGDRHARVAGCGGGGEPPNPVDGLIEDLNGDRMTVATDEDRSYEFVIDDPRVPVAHLRVHMRDRLPVRITWRADDGRRRATTIADVP